MDTRRWKITLRLRVLKLVFRIYSRIFTKLLLYLYCTEYCIDYCVLIVFQVHNCWLSEVRVQVLYPVQYATFTDCLDRCISPLEAEEERRQGGVQNSIQNRAREPNEDIQTLVLGRNTCSTVCFNLFELSSWQLLLFIDLHAVTAHATYLTNSDFHDCIISLVAANEK
jgi:hypothetical protein